MPTTLKNFIRVGMRNPFYIEIHIPRDETMFTEFAVINGKTSTTKFKLKSSVTIKAFEEANFNEQLAEIQELPQGLLNYSCIVEHQAEKLPRLMEFLKNKSG